MNVVDWRGLSAEVLFSQSGISSCPDKKCQNFDNQNRPGGPDPCPGYPTGKYFPVAGHYCHVTNDGKGQTLNRKAPGTPKKTISSEFIQAWYEPCWVVAVEIMPNLQLSRYPDPERQCQNR